MMLEAIRTSFSNQERRLPFSVLEGMFVEGHATRGPCIQSWSSSKRLYPALCACSEEMTSSPVGEALVEICMRTLEGEAKVQIGLFDPYVTFVVAIGLKLESH